MTTILDGKGLAEKILQNIKEKVTTLNRKPKLVVIQIGEDPASKVYIKHKKKACLKVDFSFAEISLPFDIDQKTVLQKIDQLNADQNVDGLIVQLPVPKQINVPQIMRQIDPKKDVDGFCAYNLGKMFLSKEFEDLPPATPLGIITLLQEYKIPLQGKDVCIVGSSNIVGKPVALMLKNRNATIQLCDIFTQNLAEKTKKADILISAVGKAKLITSEMVKKNAVVIDVGMNRDENGKLCGDVDFENIASKVSYITPVPGGVGPMTVASLIVNTFNAYKRRLNLT